MERNAKGQFVKGIKGYNTDRPSEENSNYKHGLTGHPLFIRFCGAKNRCFNKKKCPEYTPEHWGTHTAAELTLYYMGEWDKKTAEHPGEPLEIHRINGGKYEIGQVQILTAAEHRRLTAQTVGVGLPKKKVNQYTLGGEFIRRHDSMSAAAFAVNTARSNIRKVCKGKGKTSAGFKWRYADV